MSRHSANRLRLAAERHEAKDPEVALLSVHVPHDLFWFQGHFADDAVLPAVVQLREVLIVVSELWTDLERLRRVRNAKFRKPIRPNDKLLLRVERRSGDLLARFDLSRDGYSCSSGILEFVPVGSRER